MIAPAAGSIDSTASGLVGDAVPDGAALRRRAVRGGAIMLATRQGIQVLTWTVTLLVARILLPYDYGMLAMGGVFIGLGDLLAEAGINRALVRKPRLDAADQAEGFTLCLALALLLYALLCLGAPAAAAMMRNPELTTYLRVTGLALLAIPFRSVPAALLDRQLQLGRQSALFAVTAVLQSGLTLTLALAGYGYWALASSAMAARVLDAAGLAVLTGWRPRLRRPGAAARELLNFGLHVTGASLLVYTYRAADSALLSRFAGPVALGYYALALQLVYLPVDRICASFNQVAFPLFCRLQHDPIQVRNWYLRLLGLMGAVGVPVYVGLALVAGDAVAVVFGAKWLPAVLPLRLLCAVGPMMLLSTTLLTVYAALNRIDIATRFHAACALLLPAGFVVLGQRYGLTGICLTWATVYPLINLGLLYVTARHLDLGPGAVARALAPALGATAVMTAAVLLVRGALAAPDLTAGRLVAGIATGVASYGAALGLLARGTVLRDFGILWRELRGR